MGQHCDIMTAEAIRDALREQLEQSLALVRQLQKDLKEIEEHIEAKRSELPIGGIEIEHAEI